MKNLFMFLFALSFAAQASASTCHEVANKMIKGIASKAYDQGQLTLQELHGLNESSDYVADKAIGNDFSCAGLDPKDAAKWIQMNALMIITGYHSDPAPKNVEKVLRANNEVLMKFAGGPN